MEISGAEFEANFSLIENCVEASDFIAIDCEFSGLGEGNPDSTDEGTFANMAYKSACKRVGSYQVIQVGFTTFQSLGQGKYLASPFNFYVFPACNSKSRNVPDFISHPAAIKFLTEQGFDFNKLFYNNVPYTSKAAEEKYRKSKMDEITGKMEDIKLDHRAETYMKEINQQIDDWLTKEDQPSHVICPSSQYMRRVVYQSVRANYFGKVVANGRKEGIVLTRFYKRKYEKDIKNRTSRLENDIQKMAGFRRVIDILIKAKKPIIGHNCLLDICHIMKQFVLPELPDSLEEFTLLVNESFPTIFDTKYLFDTAFINEANLDSSLEDLRKLVNSFETSPVILDFGAEFCKYANSENHHHEAGYDSLITGEIFLKLAYRQAAKHNVKTEDWKSLLESDILKAHCNKVHLSRGQNRYLDLQNLCIASIDARLNNLSI